MNKGGAEGTAGDWRRMWKSRGHGGAAYYYWKAMEEEQATRGGVGGMVGNQRRC